MSLFQQESYGKPISEKLSLYLKSYTGPNDYAAVSEKTGISISTVKFVAYRTNTVTENNSRAMLELMKIAVVNCTNKIQHAKKAKECFQEEIHFSAQSQTV